MFKKNQKNCKIRKKSENFKTPYKNLEKYGSFSKFRTCTEKSVMLATLVLPVPTLYSFDNLLNVLGNVSENMPLVATKLTNR